MTIKTCLSAMKVKFNRQNNNGEPGGIQNKDDDQNKGVYTTITTIILLQSFNSDRIKAFTTV